MVCKDSSRRGENFEGLGTPRVEKIYVFKSQAFVTSTFEQKGGGRPGTRPGTETVCKKFGFGAVPLECTSVQTLWLLRTNSFDNAIVDTREVEF